MVETEGAALAQQPVIAEEPAGRVADHGIGAGAGARPYGLVKRRVITQKPRPGTGNREGSAGDFLPRAIVQDDLGRALRPPWQRGRIDQVAERVVSAFAE